MSSRGVLILTEESFTQSGREGPAGEVYQGSFGEVARLARAASPAGPTCLLIASGKLGLIDSEERIQPYPVAESRDKILEAAIMEARSRIDIHSGVLVLALRGELVQRLLEGWRAAFDGHVYASVGGSFEGTVVGAFPHAQVAVYRRAGVARIGKRASDAILSRLRVSAHDS